MRFAAAAPAQWYGTNTVSGRIVSVTSAGYVTSPRRVTTRTGSPFANPSEGCTSTHGPRRLLDERADPPGLVAGEEVRDGPPGREPHRELVVHGLGGSCHSTGLNRARPSGKLKRSSNSRGVPG